MKINLFYKKIINRGGAENLLLNHYESLKNKDNTVKIITYKNLLIKKKHKDIIIVNNFIGLILYMLKNYDSRIICHSGYLDIFFASLLLKVKYYVFLHQPSLLSFNETDKYALKVLEKLNRNDKINIFKHKMKFFKRIKKNLSFYVQTKINIRYIISRIALKRAANTFVLSRAAVKEKKLMYDIVSQHAIGAIKNNQITRYKNNLNKNGKNYYFCIVSRLDINKRIKTVIRSIRKAKYCKNFFLDIYGSGEQLDDLNRCIRILGLQKNIKCKGFLPERDKIKVLNKYDYSICLDMADFRISAYESLLARTPVILSTETEKYKIFDDSNCFIYCEPKIYKVRNLLDKIYNGKLLNNIKWKTVEENLNELKWSNYFKKINSYVL